MTREQTLKLWTGVASVLVLYTVNSLLQSIGAEPILGVGLLDDRREPMAVSAVLVASGLLLIVALVGEMYRRRSAAGWGWEAIPPVFLGPLQPQSRSVRLFLLAILVVAYIIPTLSAWRFRAIALEGRFGLSCSKRSEYDIRNISHFRELQRSGSITYRKYDGKRSDGSSARRLDLYIL